MYYNCECGSTEVVQAHSSFTKVWKKHSMVCVAHFDQLCASIKVV